MAKEKGIVLSEEDEELQKKSVVKEVKKVVRATRGMNRKEKKNLLDKLVDTAMVKKSVNSLFELSQGIKLVTRDKKGKETAYTTKPDKDAAIWLLESKYGKPKTRAEISDPTGKALKVLLYLPGKEG
jgi:hypothetical protein